MAFSKAEPRFKSTSVSLVDQTWSKSDRAVLMPMRERSPSRPKRVAPKLVAIRHKLGLSQTGMLRLLPLNCYYNRISEFERGKRFPSLLVLLSYARAGEVPLEQIVDDDLELDL